MALQRLPGKDDAGRRLRLVFVGLCVLVALLGGGWWAAQRFLRIDHYRALVIQQFEAATGKPCTIDSMAFFFLPRPHIVLTNLQVGREGLTLDIDTVNADVDVYALTRRQLVLPSVTVEGLVATLPQTAAEEAVAEANEAPTGEGAGAETPSRIHVGAVEIPQWRVLRAGADYATGSTRVEDPLGANAKFGGDAKLPGLSPEATADLQGTISRADGKFALDGKAALKAVDLAKAAGRAGLTHAILNANLAFSGSSPDDIAFTLAGTIQAEGKADVAGQVAGKAWWRGREFTVNDFTWDSPGLHAVADASRKKDGELALNLREATAEGEGLQMLLGAASTKAMPLDAGKDAALALKDVLLGRAATGEARWARGAATLRGITVTTPQGVLENLSAKARLEEGTLLIEEASASGLRLAGKVTPGAKGSMVFSLAVSGALSNPLIAARLPAAVAKGAKGQLELTRVQGTWRPGLALPEGLDLAGTLAGGELQVDNAQFPDKITGISVSFASDAKTVRAKATANSAKMGDLSFEGNLDVATLGIDGNVGFSLNRLAASFVPAGDGPNLTQSMLAAYDKASYAVALRLPASAKAPGSFAIESKSPPSKLSAVLLLDAVRGVSLGTITADFSVPFAPAAKALAPTAAGDGDAAVHFERAADGRFSGRVDLTQASLKVPPYFEKRAGAEVRLDIAGASAKGWALETLTLDLLSQPVALTPNGDGFAATDLKLDLAALRPLFPEGSEAAGTLRGSFVTSPMSASLRLAGVHLKTPSGIAIEQIDGGLDYSPEAIGFDGLHVLAYGSDFTLDGAMKDGAFQGKLSGTRADLNLLAGLSAAGSGGETGGKGSDVKGLRGTVEVALGEVLYRRASINDVKAKVNFGPKSLTVDALDCAPYGGTARGNIAFSFGAASAGNATVQLEIQNVDLKIIDDLSAAEPRGMYGPAQGSIDLRFPFGPETPPYLGVDGQISLQARDGSLGKAGASGKVLAALKATELAQLQIPSLRDKGLSFGKAEVEIACTKGVVDIQTFRLAESTHVMDAEGSIDFPRNSMDVTLRVQLLQTVRSIVGAIPLLDNLSQAGGIYVGISGSPFDPKMSVARVRPLKDLRNQGKGILNGVKTILGR